MTQPAPKHSAVRQRILETAMKLFYEQGYRATGINQVIAESGVAKASFYDHFPSKSDLLVAYAEAVSNKEMEDMRQEVMAHPSARERFFAPFGVLRPWFPQSCYRGCPFQNMLGEAGAEEPRLQPIAKLHRERFRAFLRELADDLAREDRKFARKDRDALVDTYLLLFEGAIVLSVAYRALWPVDRAEAALQQMMT